YCGARLQPQSPSQRSRHRWRARQHRAIRKRQSSFASLLRDQRIEPLRREPAMELIVDHHRRRARAVAEAVDGFERKGSIRRRLMKIDAEAFLRIPRELFC